MIKNIIFDFGGVLLNLDYQKTFDELSTLMGLDLVYPELPEELKEIYLAFERGDLNKETFLWNIQKTAKKPISEPHKIINAWNGMLLGWNPDRLPWLLEVKKHYNTYLLSNTNAIHIDWVRKDLAEQYDIHDFEDRYFDHVYYSHDVRMQKPNSDIYEHVLSDSDLIAGETVFIDDNADNVAAAKALGIRAVHHDPKIEIMEILPVYLDQK